MDDPVERPRRKRWGAVLARIWRERVTGRLDRRRLVMGWRADAVRLAGSHLPVQRFERLAQLPPSIFAAGDRAGQPRDWYRHFFDHGATLWTALERGRALGSLWVIEAQRLGDWYIPLEPDARAIYGVATADWARGRGVAAELALAAAREAGGAPVYLDCMIWNRAAQRAFAKAGFVPITVAGSRLREARAGPDA